MHTVTQLLHRLSAMLATGFVVTGLVPTFVPTLVPSATAQVPAGCSAATPAACLYVPASNYAVGGHLDLRPLDTNRANHPVPFRIRYPAGLPVFDKFPVVIWNHGGATTEEDPGLPGVTVGQQGSERRLGSFVQAGYITVHIGRLKPALNAVTPRMLLTCARAGQFDADTLAPGNPQLTAARAVQTCREFYGWHLWGPVNVAFVVDWLQNSLAQVSPQLHAVMDLNRIVVGGWSGGGATPLNIAGAEQRWTPPQQLPPRVRNLLQHLGVPTAWLHDLAQQDIVNPVVNVPGVVAFIDDAPRSPSFAGGTSGFADESFYGIGDKPFLFTSGRHDTGADNLPPNNTPELSRSVAWWQARAGNKYLAWSPEVANHSTMDLSPNGCNPPLQEAYCRALENLGVAFLDAAVLQRPAAQQWLRSNALEVMTGGRIELHRR